MNRLLLLIGILFLFSCGNSHQGCQADLDVKALLFSGLHEEENLLLPCFEVGDERNTSADITRRRYHDPKNDPIDSIPNDEGKNYIFDVSILEQENNPHKALGVATTDVDLYLEIKNLFMDAGEWEHDDPYTGWIGDAPYLLRWHQIKGEGRIPTLYTVSLAPQSFHWK